MLEFNPVVPGDMGNYDCRLVKNVENPSEIAPERIAAIEIRGKSVLNNLHSLHIVIQVTMLYPKILLATRESLAKEVFT